MLCGDASVLFSPLISTDPLIRRQALGSFCFAGSCTIKQNITSSGSSPLGLVFILFNGRPIYFGQQGPHITGCIYPDLHYCMTLNSFKNWLRQTTKSLQEYEADPQEIDCIAVRLYWRKVADKRSNFVCPT